MAAAGQPALENKGEIHCKGEIRCNGEMRGKGEAPDPSPYVSI